MEIVNFIMSVLMLILVVGAIAMMCTFPSWLAGRFHWRADRRPNANFLTETPIRRWALWWVASVTALLGLSLFLGIRSGWYTLPGAVVFVIGALVAQYFAFMIGFADIDRRKAHRNAHLYSALPEGLGPQHQTRPAEEIPPPAPLMGETEATRVQRPTVAEHTNDPFGTDLATAEYPMAEPHDD